MIQRNNYTHESRNIIAAVLIRECLAMKKMTRYYSIETVPFYIRWKRVNPVGWQGQKSLHRTRRRRERVSGEFLDGSSWIDPFAPAVRVVSYILSEFTARFLFRSKTFLRKKNQIKSKLTL
jgi:hypothetical protein